MDIKSVYDIAGRAMAAQLVRLNTVASNLANAGSTTGCLLYTSPSPRDDR